MADQWELDTLAAINERRRSYGVTSFKWSRRLEKETRHYVAHMSAWEYLDFEKVPGWVHKARGEIVKIRLPPRDLDRGIRWVCVNGEVFEIPPHPDLPWEHRSPSDFPTGTQFTEIFRGRHFEYKLIFERDSGAYYRRPIQPDYVSTPLWDVPERNSKHVVCSCRCPHWTPPEKIADLLWSERLESCRAKSAVVVIQNDDRFTYAAFACK